MGDPDTTADWPDEDPIDWVRLFMLSPATWFALLEELRRRQEPAAVAWFHDACEEALRRLTDVHQQLPVLGLTVSGLAGIYEKAWAAQNEAVDHDDRPLGETETSRERNSSRRSGWRDDLDAVLAPAMADAVINLHLRGAADSHISTILLIPADWPAKIVGAARLSPKAQAVVRAHLEGGSLAGIAKATGVPATSALRILRQVGEVPHGARERVDAADRARAIVRLREREGLTYKEIADRLGCSMDTVKNVLRRKRRPRYGKGKGPAS